MKFYRENKINPAASCLPILLQIPIFISLYYVLRDFEKEVLTVKYPGSDVSWLHVVPNITDNITSHWSGWLLVAIYVASQLGSILFTPMPDPRQKWIMLALPFVFILFIVNATFPVGLLLYWVTTNLWTVGQGLITRRLIPKTAAPLIERRSSRTPPKPPPPSDDGGGNGAKPGPQSPKPRPTAANQPPRRVRRKRGAGRR